MRARLVRALAAAGFVAACAHVEAPPGGPEDKLPPQLIVTRPDSLAVEPGWRGPVVLVFDERVSELGVATAVTVSPRTSPVVVDHSGDEIRVSLRGGWQPGVVYHVTVLPEVQDLFQNRLGSPLQLVFSTGPEIPDTWSGGEVIDPITGKPEVGARVEAIRRPDSLVYAVPTDSAGRFVLARVPEGEYLLRAYRDLNRNRRLDAYEPRDSAVATLAASDSARLELGLLAPDSTAPVLAGAELNRGRIELRFDDYLDPSQRIAPARVQIRTPGGSFVPVSRVGIGTLEAEAADPQREQEAAQPDTAARARPLPSQLIVVQLGADAELEPGVEYQIRVTDVRNLLGLSGDSETTLTLEASALPQPDAAPDSAVADTAGVEAAVDTAVADTAGALVIRRPAPPRSDAFDRLKLFRTQTPDSR